MACVNMLENGTGCQRHCLCNLRLGCLGGGIPSLSPHQHNPEGHEELVGPSLTAAEGLLTHHLLHSLSSFCEQE
ncbi:hypothetical protein Pmani_035934 [Petrolisthes manimaculis]|uniref:Uncharacterized protein n=1 Tax=Petrolisthes manimaculis TaxID=1843537 RepID=A0AAE1NLA6_9EUCA|nr:hypothetical protein Pmani_035934 [Petrolisthes manimaculis]